MKTPKIIGLPLTDPIRELLDDAYVTPRELADRWRMSITHLSNMRANGRGPAYVKFNHGAVRYRLVEIVKWELEGHRATDPCLTRFRLALRCMPDVSDDLRARIDAMLYATAGATPPKRGHRIS